jgi:hypothetical protein
MPWPRGLMTSFTPDTEDAGALGCEIELKKEKDKKKKKENNLNWK